MATLLDREFAKARKRPMFRLRRLWVKLQVALIRLGENLGR